MIKNIKVGDKFLNTSGNPCTIVGIGDGFYSVYYHRSKYKVPVPRQTVEKYTEYPLEAGTIVRKVPEEIEKRPIPTIGTMRAVPSDRLLRVEREDQMDIVARFIDPPYNNNNWNWKPYHLRAVDPKYYGIEGSSTEPEVKKEPEKYWNLRAEWDHSYPESRLTILNDDQVVAGVDLLSLQNCGTRYLQHFRLTENSQNGFGSGTHSKEFFLAIIKLFVSEISKQQKHFLAQTNNQPSTAELRIIHYIQKYFSDEIQINQIDWYKNQVHRDKGRWVGVYSWLVKGDRLHGDTLSNYKGMGVDDVKRDKEYEVL